MSTDQSLRLEDYLNPLDVDALARGFHRVEPFPHFCIDGFLRPEFLREVRDAYPDYEEAAQIGKEFGALNERSKVQITEPLQLPDPVRRLSQLLASRPFREVLTRISGIPALLADPELRGGGMHLIRGGGRLDVHVDFNVHRTTSWFRRLNILVFLNERWEESWGGALELWDEDVRTCHVAGQPLLNRCMAFETSPKSWHGVAPVQCPANVARKSFAAYYYTAEAPAGWCGKNHTTIFRPRPGERLRNALGRPLERLLGAARRGAQRIPRRRTG